MAPSDSTSTASLPTAESLLLSASVFTSDVSSWIPANFGHVVPPAEAEKEWQTLLRSAGEGKDRLGLGHPLIDAPKTGVKMYKGGLQGLEKSLKNGKRRLGEEEKERGDKGETIEMDEEEEEEESRASMVGKRKRAAVFDPLSAGKKKKGSQKWTSTSATNSTVTSARASPAVVDTAQPPAPSVQDNEILCGSISNDDPPAKEWPLLIPDTSLNNAQQQSDSEQSATFDSAPSKLIISGSAPSNPLAPTLTPASPIKSKSARKRERKRLAKLQTRAED